MRKIATIMIVCFLVGSTLPLRICSSFDQLDSYSNNIVLSSNSAAVFGNDPWDLNIRLIPEKSSSRATLVFEATSHKKVEEVRLALHLDANITLVEGERIWFGPVDVFEKKIVSVLVELPKQGSYEVDGYAVSTKPVSSDGSMVKLRIDINADGRVSTRLYDGEAAILGTQLSKVTVIPGGGNSISVEGYFYYMQSMGPWVQLPIRGAEVEVYDDDGWLGRQKMGSGITDDNGYFKITGMRNPSDVFEGAKPDVYVEVHARNWVTEVLNNPWWWFFGDVYKFRTTIRQDVGDNDAIDFGSWICPSEQYNVWHIYNTMQAGYWFMVDQTGNAPPRVRTFYNDIFQKDTAYYYAMSLSDTEGVTSLIPDWLRDLYDLAVLLEGSTGIHFPFVPPKPTEFFSLTETDAIFHEYGHFIMDVYADLAPPIPVSRHDYYTIYWVEKDVGDGVTIKVPNSQHAFVEGWANFFSAVARHWWGAPVTDYAYNPYVECDSLLMYDGCEATIAGILWDMYDFDSMYAGLDPPKNDDDAMSVDFRTIWEVLTQYDPDFLGWPIQADHPWTIQHFWDGYRFLKAGHGVSYLYEILLNHKIEVEDGTLPTNPTEYSIEIKEDYRGRYVTVTWLGARDIVGGISQVYVEKYMYSLTCVPEDLIRGRSYYEFVNDVDGTGTYVSPYLKKGSYYLNLRAVDRSGNAAADTYHIPIRIALQDEPLTILQASVTIPFDASIIANAVTTMTLTVDAAEPVSTTHYSISDDQGNVVVEQTYTGPSFRFGDGLSDGIYTLTYYSIDLLGEETHNTRTVILDTTPPTTSISISDPKTEIYTKIGKITHIKSSNTITLNPSDGAGTGVRETKYRINNAKYDLGWQTYQEPIQLTSMSDGAYWIEYYSVDNTGNEETHKKESIVLDNAGPSLRIQLEEDTALQDRVTITTSAFDLGSGMGSVTYTISRVSRGGITPVEGFRDLLAELTDKENLIFSRKLDLSPLDNGVYLITAKGMDVLGNMAELSLRYSLCNFDITTLVPLSQTSKAGRTVPVKFTLKAGSLTDPDQPFVYNEALTIDIRVKGAHTPSQVSTFGTASTDYRISVPEEIYIVNFRTDKNPKTYLVTVYRGTRTIGSFTFSTTK